MIYKDFEFPEPVESPWYVWKICNALLEAGDETDRKKEHLWAIGLDPKENVEYVELVSLGNLGTTAIHPREFFSFAVQKRVHAVIMAHSHTTQGTPEPSPADRRITVAMAAAGQLWGIPLRDHVIVSRNGLYSLLDEEPEIFERAIDKIHSIFESLSQSP